MEGAPRALEAEVAVGPAVVAQEAGAVDADGGEVGGELVAGAVAAYGGEERRAVATGGERPGDVLGDAAGLAGDAAGDVGAVGERVRGAADDVPVRGADAEEGRGARRQLGAKRSLM